MGNETFNGDGLREVQIHNILLSFLCLQTINTALESQRNNS